MTAVDSAPPILLISGWMEKVMDSQRLCSFHWPYSMVSARNISIKKLYEGLPHKDNKRLRSLSLLWVLRKKNTA